MSVRRALVTALCVILVVAASPPRVWGQAAPAADPSPAGSGGDLQPLVTETTTGPPQGVRGWDMDFSQPPCSRWTASIEFITLERIGSVPYTLVEILPHNEDPLTTIGTEALNAKDLRQGFSGGPQLGLIHHGDDGSELEVSYFQIDGWGSTKSIAPIPEPGGHHAWLVMRAPGTFVQFQNDPGQMMEWGSSSQLYNAEVNVRRSPWRSLTVLAGFRWVNLSEDLEGILLPSTAHGTGSFWDTQTKNNLYGFQIGMDATLLERNRFSIDSILKAGIFDNHVDETALVRIDRIQFVESDSTHHLAFLGQIGVQCKYQVTPRLSLKAGYEALWLQGVALAPGQISETYCHGSIDPYEVYVESLGVNCSSGVFYHGATAGLEYSF